jgi:hypothetical protein
MNTFELSPNLFADTYGGCSYSTSTFNSGDSCSNTTTTTSPSSTSKSSLVDTGTEILGFVTLAAIIIFVSLIIRFKKRSKTAAKPNNIDA